MNKSLILIKLIGIDISTEVKFDLRSWIKGKYKKYEDEIMSVTNTEQFRKQ